VKQVVSEQFASGLSDAVADIAERVRSGVVQVRAGRGGIGSGVIWRVGEPDAQGESEATIITNAHVVGAARDGNLSVRLRDGREIAAALGAVDPGNDLASLRVKAGGLQPLEEGDPTQLRVGEVVLAVGNPFGLEGAVTVGVVAARAGVDPEVDVEPADAPSRRQGRRDVPRLGLIHADIRLYPGNSGGPLTDARGRVVGINAMIGGGLAFAIPSRAVQRFLEEAGETRPPLYLGVQVLTVPLTPALRTRLGVTQETAALVAGVEAGSPAEAAGILIGDMLLAIDDVPIQGAEHLIRVVRRGGVSAEPRKVVLARGGEHLELSLKPEARAA
jgi:serine protease Do